MSKRPDPNTVNRRKKQGSGLTVLMLFGVAVGLFAVFFLAGLYGVPSRTRAPGSASDLDPRAPVSSDRDGGRVRIRELPARPRRDESTASRRAESAPPERRETARSQTDPGSEIKEAATDNRAKDRPDKVQPVERPPATVGEARVVEPAPAPETATEEPAEPPRTYRVQAGAFTEEENARRMADRLAGSGYPPSVSVTKTAEGTLYRVQVGPFNDRKTAENAVRELGQQGVSTRVTDE